MYRDRANHAFATLCSNSDLISMGLNTNNNSFRMVSVHFLELKFGSRLICDLDLLQRTMS